MDASTKMSQSSTQKDWALSKFKKEPEAKHSAKAVKSRGHQNSKPKKAKEHKATQDSLEEPPSPSLGMPETEQSRLVKEEHSAIGGSLQALIKARPFCCAVCQKSFAQKSNLVTHFRVHTGSRPYMCMECGKTFSTSSNAVTHQRVHTGERPYSCGDCGKTFSISSNLVTHQRVHTGERPYVCSDCGKSFTHRSNLVIHQRAHSGEKPYMCQTCGKNFTHSSHLVAHQKVHTSFHSVPARGMGPYTSPDPGLTEVGSIPVSSP